MGVRAKSVLELRTIIFIVDSFFLPNYFVGRLSPLPNGHIKPRNGEKFGAVYSPEDEETAPNTVYHT